MRALLLPLLLAGPTVPAELLEGLKDKEPAVRIKAIRALARLGPEAVAPLVAAIDDEDPQVGQSAAYALRFFKADPKVALATLQPHLKAKSPAVRRGVSAALPRCGALAAPALLGALRDDDATVRRQAALSLQVVAAKSEDARKEARPGLEKALEDGAPAVRLAAVQALARCGRDAVPALLAATRDADAKVRANALAGVALVKPEPKSALATVAKLAKEDPDESVRQSAVRTLAALGPGAVGPLTAALGDREPAVQAMALKALARVGPEAGKAAPTVRRLAAATDNDTVRGTAIALLARLGPDGEPALLELLRERSSAIRLACLQQIGRKGRPSPKALPGLVEALTDPEPEVRILAAHALGLLGTEAKGAVAALLRAVKDPDPRVAAIAAKALAKVKGE